MLKDHKYPVIGIVSRINSDSSSDDFICILDAFRIGRLKCGGLPPLLLPPQTIHYNPVKPRNVARLTDSEKKYLQESVNLCDGILLPGGSRWYEFDEYIYKYALQKDIPILGICAGMQMMACMDNNRYTTCFDTSKKNETTIEHYQKNQNYVHAIHIIEGSLLSQIIEENKIMVNSRHHYHVDRVTSLKISAYSEDGLIEAIEDTNRTFVLGVQWHPESMIKYDENAQKLLASFIQACQK